MLKGLFLTQTLGRQSARRVQQREEKTLTVNQSALLQESEMKTITLKPLRYDWFDASQAV